MPSDPQELGKGLFGYRKSAVNQILSDRDVMLRQAEGRVRAAESRVAELEYELNSMRDRNSRMDEQLDRLRTQLDALAGRVDVASPLGPPPAAPEARAWPPDPQTDSPSVSAWEEASVAPEEPPADQALDQGLEFGEQEAAFAGLDGLLAEPAEPEAVTPPVAPEPDQHPDVSIFDEGEADRTFAEATGGFEAPVDQVADDASWMAEEPDRIQPDSGMDDIGYGHGDYSYEPFPTGGEAAAEAAPFAFSEDSGQFEQEPDDGGLTAFESYEGTPASAEAWDVSPHETARQVEPEVEVAPEPSHVESAPVIQPPAVEPPPAPAEPPARSVSSETIDLTNRFLTDEIQGILSAAEESAARIVERARATTQHQIAQSNRLWREVQAEVSRFASWREQIDPVIQAVQSKVENVRSEIDGVPERIRQALAPMADSISSIDSDLAELAAACSPPLLLTPSGLDAESDQLGQWTEGLGPTPRASEGSPGQSEHEGGRSPGHLAG